MATTIQISEKLRDELKKRKLYAQESYEEILWDLIEDTEELSEETKRGIEESLKDYAAGRYVTLAQFKKERGIR